MKWIDIKVRQPLMRYKLLVFATDSMGEKGIYKADYSRHLDKNGKTVERWSDDYYNPLYEITYWMLLPEIPNHTNIDNDQKIGINYDDIYECPTCKTLHEMINKDK